MTNEPTAEEPTTGGEQPTAAPDEPTGAQPTHPAAEPLARHPGVAPEPDQPTYELGATLAEPDPAPNQAEPARDEPEPTVAEPSSTLAEPTLAEPTLAEPTLAEPGPTLAEPTQPRYTGPPPDDARLAGGAFPAAGGAVPPPGGYQPPGNPPPGYQPPGNPPPGYQPPGYPPPAAAGWASRRYGLVRPTSGRVFAGVCGALGRATNTDPVLWRVLLAVFTLVGGIGLLVYVIGWLFIPAEGDTASPIEALLGRGRSSTSPVLVIVITAIVVIAMGSVISRGVRSSFFPVGIVIVAIILIARRTRHAAPGSTPVPPGQAPPEAMPGGAMPGAPVPGPAGQVPVTATTGPAGATAPGGPAGATGPAQPQPAGYRPPFAPHGPYAMGSRYPYPGLTFNPTMEPAPASAPPARQRSRLGWVFFALALVTAGIMGVAGGHRISVGAYIAVPLAVIGIGLVVGAWAGRARGLIFPGLLLTLALAATPVHLNLQPGSGDVTWAPISYSDLAHEYRHGLGDVRLDLSRIDFTGHPDTNVVLRTNAGDVRVTLPSKVDATVDVTIRAGDAQVLGTNWSSPQSGRHTVSDDGSDGPGGGALHLTIQMDLGSLRVER